MADYAPFFVPGAVPGLRNVSMGELHVPTGLLYCGDPFLSDELCVLEQRVNPGSYSVELCLADLPDWGERVALARLLLSSTPAVSWRPAAYSAGGESTSSFEVDAGLACFMDRDAAVLLAQSMEDFYRSHSGANYYSDLLAPMFACNAVRPGTSGDWTMHTPKVGARANIAMFASGLGDGSYKAWWGLDAAGKPAMLVADFEVLEPSPEQ